MPWVFCVIVAFKRAALNSLETRNVTIKPDDDHLVDQGLPLWRPERPPSARASARPKKTVISGISLQHVLPDRKTFILHPRVARLLGDDLQIGELRKGFIEAFVPILFRRCAELTLDNGDLAFSASNLANIFAKGSSRPDTVGGDERVARGIGSIAINGNDGNLRRPALL